MYIDTHAHLTLPEFSDLDLVLQRAKDSQVGIIINVSFDLECSRASVELAKQQASIYAAVGIHPQHAHQIEDSAFEVLKQLAENKKVVALGETGLDYHYTAETKEIQKEVFRKHLRLAQELDLPVIIHDREAHQDVLAILKAENKGNLRAVFHCFSGDEKFAQEVINLGFLISFVGNLTFKKADKLCQVAAVTELAKIMLETDCPYLAPQPWRGKRNEPAYLVEVARRLAEIKKVKIEEIGRITTQNAKFFFQL